MPKETEKFSPKPLEIHKGEVVEMADDFATVELTNPEGIQYTRRFETDFLKAIGIKEGDRVQIEFEEQIRPGEGIVTMRVMGLGPPTREEIDKEVNEIMNEVDLKLIREKFGQISTDEGQTEAGGNSNWDDERLSSMRPH